MGIQWEQWKNEIYLLYIVQDHTLEYVRAQLLARGLDASIRTYQLRLDEWLFHKNQRSKKSKDPDRDRRHRKTLVRNTLATGEASSSTSTENYLQLSTSDHNFVPEEPLNYHSQIRIPEGDMLVSELLVLIRSPLADDCAFEILLSKWQSDGEYMKCAKNFLWNPNRRKRIMCPTSTGGNLFNLIGKHLPPADQVTLTKLFLEYNLLPMSNEDFDGYTGPLWAKTWYQACRASYWSSAKTTLLSQKTLIIEQTGKTFLDCALVVIAERLSINLLVKIHNVAKLSEPVPESTILESQGFRAQVLSMFQFFDGREVKPLWDVLVCNMVDLIGWATSAMGLHFHDTVFRDGQQRENKLKSRIAEMSADSKETVDLRYKVKELREENYILTKKYQDLGNLRDRIEEQDRTLEEYRRLLARYVSADGDNVDNPAVSLASPVSPNAVQLDKRNEENRDACDDTLFQFLNWV